MLWRYFLFAWLAISLIERVHGEDEIKAGEEPTPNPYRFIIDDKKIVQKLLIKNGGGKIVLKFPKRNRPKNGTIKAKIVIEFQSKRKAKKFKRNKRIKKIGLEVDHPKFYQSSNEEIRRLIQNTPWGIDRVFDNGLPNSAHFPYGNTMHPICIIDSGIQLSHSDLPNDASNADPSQGTSFSTDVCGHGTHVAGTVAAINNKEGVVGVYPGAPSVKIVKVFGSSCTWTYTSTLIQAAQFCVDDGAKIISMSLGGSFYSGFEAASFQSFYLYDGVLSIAAAGNNGSSSYSYPASYSSVMSVGATSSTNSIAYFSQHNDAVDVSAPGVDVYSTENNYYGTKSGTSMATPHVSGVALLLWNRHPECKNYEIRDAIESKALDLGTLGWDSYYGHGLVKYWPTNSRLLTTCGAPFAVSAGYVLQDSVLERSDNKCRLHVGDYNGDGKDDLFRSCDDSAYNYLFYGTTTTAGFVGFGYILTGSVLENSDKTCRLHVGDYNGDGKDDLFRTCDDSAYNYLFHGTAAGFDGFGYMFTGSVLENSDKTCRLHVGDYNGDGKDDLLRTCDDNAYNYLFYGATTAGFVSYGYVLTSSVLEKSDNTCRLHVADYDGDGKDDLLRSCDNADYNYLFHGDDTGFASYGYVLTSSVLEKSDKTCRLHVGDYNGDGKDDLFRSCDNADYNYLFHGADAGFVGFGYVFNGLTVLENSNNTCRVHVGDYNGDGKDDLFRSCNNADYNHMFYGMQSGLYSLGSLRTGTVFEKSDNTCRVHVGDYNGDGEHDIFRSCDDSNFNALFK